MTIVTLGIDLGKNLNSVVGLDEEGRIVLRRRVRRATLTELAGRLERCTVAMEACCGAHHVGRLFAAQGHEVRLMSPEYVRPYVKAQKNDDNDAEGIAEAATRPTMRFVELKSQDRLDLQTVHRVRSRLVAAHKALLNQLRAILLERGHTFRQGRTVLAREIDALLAEPPSDLSARILSMLADTRAEWRELDRRIDALTTSWPSTPGPTRRRAGSPRSRGSACSARPRWWRPSATARRSGGHEICRHGSSSCRGR